MNAFICGEEFSKKSTKSKQLAIVVVYKVATITSHPNFCHFVFVSIFVSFVVFLYCLNNIQESFTHFYHDLHNSQNLSFS